MTTFLEMTHARVETLVKKYLTNSGYAVAKKSPMMQIGAWRRYPDVYAKKDGKVLVVECKGGKRDEFYKVINALGQVLAIKAHNPDFGVAIAVPSYWGDDCLSHTIRKAYRIRLLMANTFVELVSEVESVENP